MRALIVGLVLVLARPVYGQAEPGVQTPIWEEPDPPLDLHWHALALPEYAVELLFSPIGVLVSAVERYRLDKRIYDLLHWKNIALTPKLKIALGDGFGAGANLSFKQLFGGEEKLKFGGLYRLDGDYEAGARYEQSIAAADGRVLDLLVEYEVDQNEPFYGIGGDTPDAKHVMQQEVLNAYVGFDTIGAGVLSLSGEVQAGMMRIRTVNGVDASAPGVGDVDATVAPPPEFGRTVAFPWFSSALRFDRRDNTGRPTRGYIAQLRGSYTQALDGEPLSAMTGVFDFEGYIPLLPDRRVLLIGLGLGGSIRARSEHEVPTHRLVTLGRSSGLRGYSRDRFRDELGWWSTLEYRWPIWEYLDHGIALTPMIFFDAGRVAQNLDGLFDARPKYAGGVGIRGAHDHFELLRLQLAMSPEGLQFDFSVGADL